MGNSRTVRQKSAYLNTAQ